MTRFLSLVEVLELHRRLIDRSGGAYGIRAPEMLDAALAQPQMTFSGVDLYETLPEKAAALCFSIVMDHPFIDGTSESGTPRWKFFSSATAFAWKLAWMSRNN